MTDKELVERLRLNANCMMDEWEPTLCKRSEFITAADRIEQLHAELTNERIDNTNLIGELATVTAERDRYKEPAAADAGGSKGTYNKRTSK